MIKRGFEDKFRELLHSFRCVSLSGARQVGKSFFLKKICRELEGVYMTLDDPLIRQEVEDDPLHWIRRNRKIDKIFVIDEAAKCPEIFAAVKVIVDAEDPRPSQIVLASSSNYLLLRKIKETLAGRVGILEIYSLSWLELQGKGVSRLRSLVEGDGRTLKNQKIASSTFNRQRTDLLLMGGFCEIQNNKSWDFTRQWAAQYFSTYILPLAVELFHITKQRSFEQVYRQLALRSAQLVNYSDIASTTDVSSVTVKNHIHYLETMMVCRSVPQYFRNAIKRLVKTPKIHMLDPIFITWNFGVPQDFGVLAQAKIDGALYESWFFGELLKSIAYESLHYEVSTWHTQDQAEVDFILTDGVTHVPIELKYKKKISPRDLSGIRSWLQSYDEVTKVAYVVYCGDEIVQLDKKIWAVPDHYFFGVSE